MTSRQARRIAFWWFLLCWVWAPIVRAQDSLLPALTAARAKYPTPMSPQQLGEFLNNLAWDARHFGWGLHAKDAGNRCPQPLSGRGISCDLLVHEPSGSVYDVLIDSEGAAVPSWSFKGSINSMSNFVRPTGTVSEPPIPPQPPTGIDLGPILSRLEQLKNDQSVLLSLLGEHDQRLGELRQWAEAEIAAVRQEHREAAEHHTGHDTAGMPGWAKTLIWILTAVGAAGGTVVAK